MQPHPVHNQLVPSHLQTRARGGARRRARQLKKTEQTRARQVQRAAAAASAAARGAALADAVAAEETAILGDDGLLMIDDDLVPHAVLQNVVRTRAQQHTTTHDGASSTDQQYLPCRSSAHPDYSMRQDPCVNDSSHSSSSGSASFPALLPPAELARRREQQRIDHERKAVTAAHAARAALAAAHAAYLSAASAEWDTTIYRRVLRALEMNGGRLAASDVVGLLGALLKNDSTNDVSEPFNSLEQQLNTAEKERRWQRIKSVMGEVALLARTTGDSDLLFWQLRDTHSGQLAAELAAEAAAAAINAATAAARAAMGAVKAAEAGPPPEQAITTWSPSLVEWARQEPRLARRIEREIEPLFHSNLHPTKRSVQLKHMRRSDRKHVHEICEICGLHSASFNDARGRYVSVTVLPDTHAPSVALSLVASVPAAVLRHALANAAMVAIGAAHAAQVAAARYPVAIAAAAAIGASTTAAQCADCAVETAKAAQSQALTKQPINVGEIAKEQSATPVPSEHQSGATDLSVSSSSTSSDDEFFLALAK
eukprot:g2633.t1